MWWQLCCTAPDFRAGLPHSFRLCLPAPQWEERMFMGLWLSSLALLFHKPRKFVRQHLATPSNAHCFLDWQHCFLLKRSHCEPQCLRGGSVWDTKEDLPQTGVKEVYALLRGLCITTVWFFFLSVIRWAFRCTLSKRWPPCKMLIYSIFLFFSATSGLIILLSQSCESKISTILLR